MSLKAANKVDTNKYELEVSVDPSTFEEAIERTYHKNKGKINVGGFRKGKAPRKIIEKLYGEEVFFEDAINDIYPIEVSKAVEEAKLELVDRPEIEIVSVSKEDGIEIKAVCIVKPEVEIKDYKGIKATKTVKNVTDEEITEELTRMSERNGRLVSIDDRAVIDGDITVIDFEGFVDGVAFDGGKAEKFSLTIGSGQFIPGFEEQIIGKKIDDEFDVEVTFPEEYQAEELAGKPAVFKVKIHEIKHKELPEIDDEFAKDASEFDSLDELKEDIKNKLTQAKEKASENELEEQIANALMEKLEAEIPQAMFDNRVAEMISDFEHRIGHQGMTLENYLQYTGMEMDSFKKLHEEQATKQVKLRLALEKISELEGIEISEDDLNDEFQNLADTHSIELERVKMLVNPSDLELDMKVSKAMDLVRETAKIEEIHE
ncbi:MAG: trigger factor [Clostridiales bacterium]|nr:trigger factor [Clostridiales bacterium]